MTDKKIIITPNSILLRKSEEVGKITPKILGIVIEMIDFLDEHSEDNLKPIGLSACQLGYSFRMIAFRNNPISKDRDDIIILINPEYVYGKGHHLVIESCLSLPKKKYLIKRSKIVKIRGITLDGIPRSFRGRDVLGQVFQHELNHLDGIMINTIGEKVK